MNDEVGYVRVPADRPVRRKRLDPQRERGHLYLNRDLLSGEIRGTITAITPIHVGTGDLEDPRRLSPSPDNPEGMKLVAPFFREAGRLTIPGSSLKGAFRHLFELITYSCLAQANRYPNQGGYVPPDLRACYYRADQRRKSGNELCPACRVFGGQGYLGQVFFRSAHVIGEQAARIEFAPQRWAPKVRPEDDARRKVYTHLITTDPLIEPVEALPKDTQLELRVDFRNLEPVELGLLLIVLGQDPNGPIYPKLGGVKAHGFGAVEITLDRVEQATKDDYSGYETGGTVFQADALQSYITTAKADQAIFYRDGWQEMVKVLGNRPEGF